MFKTGTLQEQYEQAAFVCAKTRKFAKITAAAFAFIFWFITTSVACESVGDASITTGNLLTPVIGTIGGYLYGYVFGSCLSWTYYWLESKGFSIFWTAVLWGYIGLFIWLIYRNKAKKLKKALKGQTDNWR